MYKKKLFNNTIIYAIGQIVPNLLGFFLLPLFTRFLTTDDYGILSYTNSLSMFLIIFSLLSLNTFLLRSYFDYEDEISRKKLIGNVFTFIVLFNTVLLFFLFLVGPKTIEALDIQVKFFPFVLLALLNNFFNVLSVVPLIIFRVKEKAFLFVALNVSKTIFQYFLTVYLIVDLGWGVLGNYYGKLFVNLAFAVVYLYIIFKNSIFNINFSQIKNGLKFSLPLLPGAIAYYLLSFSDRIILERFVSLSDMGIYSVAFILGFSLNILIESGYKAFEPVIYSEFGKPSFNIIVGEIRKNFMFVIFVLAMFISLFSKEIFKIMASSEFYSGYKLVPLFVLSAIIKGEHIIFSTTVIAAKNTKLITVSTLVGGLASIISNIIFVPYIGIYAAAFTSVLSFLIMTFFIYRAVELENKSIRQDVMAFCIGCTIVYLMHYRFLQEISAVNFILKFICAIVYGLILSRIFNIKFLLFFDFKTFRMMKNIL